MSRGRRAAPARWLEAVRGWMPGLARRAGPPAAALAAEEAATVQAARPPAVAPEAPPEAPPAVPPRPRSLRLLVAEDVLIFREILRNGLQRAGHVVVFAEDGAQAVRLAARLRFDLILLDLGMPVMDGLEAAIRIRALSEAGAQVPILGLTTAPGEAVHAACAAAGMDACLAKPIDWDRLLAALHLHVAAAEAGRGPGLRSGPTAVAKAAAYDGAAMTTASHIPAPVDLAAESVAGEEDPGASIDMAAAPAGTDAAQGDGAPAAVPAPPAPMAPGDEAPAGAPGTGENICPACGGSGRQGQQACSQCQGTGKVTTGIGGA